jgi:transcriptional regulator with XRE-family HTH domain
MESIEKITSAEIFSDRLRTVRGDRSKVEFARLIGTTAQNYQRYEAGRIPDAVILTTIAERCHVTVDWLLGRTAETGPIGELRKIGSVTERENVSLRYAPTKALEEDLQRRVNRLPEALPGRDRLDTIRWGLDILVELQERCVDEWTGKSRGTDGKREERPGGRHA